jgi:hypothetical protein
VSPNGEYLAFLDTTPQDDFMVDLIVVPVAATNISEAVIRTHIRLIPRNDVSAPAMIQWSTDSNAILAGDDGVVVEIGERLSRPALIQQPFIRTTRASEDNIFAKTNMEDGSTYISDSQGIKNIEVASHISQMSWITSELLLSTIGQNIYVYDLTQDRLELVAQEGPYQIVGVDTTNEQAYVTVNSELFMIGIIND